MYSVRPVIDTSKITVEIVTERTIKGQNPAPGIRWDDGEEITDGERP
jgi:hypothetical protein